MTDYEMLANDFAKKTGTKLTILGEEYKPFFGEKQPRWVFKCRLTRNRKRYTFEFGQSLYNGAKEPTMYDVLSCITTYDVGSFEDFCWEFGYDTDSRKAERTYNACVKEYAAVSRLFGDVITDLQNIN